MRYSFVWDHWVYLPSLGIIALAAAGVARAGARLRAPVLVYGFAVVVLPVLGILTWRQAGSYRDMETLWRTTVARNPNSWMTLSNLGDCFYNRSQLEEAMGYYRKAVQTNPNAYEALSNVGLVLAAEGRWDEAIASYRQALQVCPVFYKALNNLGLAFAAQGRWDEAIEQYRKAIQINPGFYKALNDLGLALAAQGRLEEAIGNFQKAIQADPNHAETFVGLGMALAQSGRTREAAAQYRAALKLNPDLAGALNNLAWILAASPEAELRDGAEAVRLAERACELTHDAEPLCVGTLAAAYAEAGRFPKAVATAEKAAQLADRAGLNDLASKNRQLLELYRAGKAYHESLSPKP
jgi:tetratricopeptide (TPR) repeat protein